MMHPPRKMLKKIRRVKLIKVERKVSKIRMFSRLWMKRKGQTTLQKTELWPILNLSLHPKVRRRVLQRKAEAKRNALC